MARANMRCEEVVALLPGYAGEEEPYPHGLEVHLATCRSCATEDARYREVLSGVRALRDLGRQAPDGLALRVTERTARPDVAWRGHARRLRRDPRTRYAAVGIGGAVVGAAAIAFLVRRSSRRSDLA